MIKETNPARPNAVYLVVRARMHRPQHDGTFVRSSSGDISAPSPSTALPSKTSPPLLLVGGGAVFDDAAADPDVESDTAAGPSPIADACAMVDATETWAAGKAGWGITSVPNEGGATPGGGGGMPMGGGGGGGGWRVADKQAVCEKLDLFSM